MFTTTWKAPAGVPTQPESAVPPPADRDGPEAARARIIGPGLDRKSLYGQSQREPRRAAVGARHGRLAPPPELETDEFPDSLVAEFSSLTTPYCWVITEDAVAGYDGAAPSAVGKSGPGNAVAGDVTEALNAGRFFRLTDGKGRGLATGRAVRPKWPARARAA